MTEAATSVERSEEDLIAMRETFQSKGWKLLMEDVKEAMDQSKEGVWSLRDDREIAILQGNVHTLRWISSQEQIVEQLLAQDVEDEGDADLLI